MSSCEKIIKQLTKHEHFYLYESWVLNSDIYSILYYNLHNLTKFNVGSKNFKNWIS